MGPTVPSSFMLEALSLGFARFNHATFLSLVDSCICYFPNLTLGRMRLPPSPQSCREFT